MPDINRVGLFGTRTRTNVLLAIHLLGETHAAELANLLEISLSHAQKTVYSLEKAGIVVVTSFGKTRRIQINPRYPFKADLMALLSKMAESEKWLIERASTLRRRPRRTGKPL